MANTLADAAVILSIISLPGPTNAILMSAGATSSFRESWHFIFAAALAFVVSAVLWFTLETRLTYGLQHVAAVMKSICVAILIYSAWKMWAKNDLKVLSVLVTLKDVVIVTLSNPKTLIVASFLMSMDLRRAGVDSVGFFAALGFLCILVSGGWLFLGTVASSVMPVEFVSRSLSKVTSIILAGFALLISVSLVWTGER